MNGAGTRAAVTALLLLTLSLMGCGARSGPPVTTVLDDDAITVGSFNFPESEVLAEIYAQALEARGFLVRRELDIGPRELLIPALQRGLVELVPEYSGSLLGFLGGEPTSDSATTHQRLALELAPRGLTLLSAAPAEDHNAFAISTTIAERLSIESLSDLGSFAPGMTFGGPAECPDRTLCLKGLVDVYGLRFEEFIALDAGGPLTAQALNDGTIDVGLLFSSDPILRAGALTVLRDDRHLQPAENVTPVTSRSALERFGPGVADALNAVSALLRTTDLRGLNAAMAAGQPAAEAAREWLRANGFEAPSE